MPIHYSEHTSQLRPKGYSIKVLWLSIFIVGVLTVSLLHYINTPTTTNDTNFVIAPNSSVRAIASQATDAGLVRSEFTFYIALLQLKSPERIQGGIHVIPPQQTVFSLARALAKNNLKPDTSITITFPEGFYARNFYTFIPPEITANNQVHIDIPSVEGYLFPDTYFIPATYGEQEVFALLQETFTEKITPLEKQIQNSGYTLEEVIILASIIEREANDPTSMGMVAGILENRINIGMPLQVDASVAYGLQKSGVDLTRADIEADGPYNTYTRAGLPPTPISNPGLQAIEAVLEPIPSDYIFYITGNDGNFYYAETLDQHNRNIARYLR